MKQEIDYINSADVFHTPTNNQTEDLTVALQPIQFDPDDYSIVLENYAFHYVEDDLFYLVGEIGWTQGWIIDISCIISQLSDLFHIILPILQREKVTFKIIRNGKIANNILDSMQSYTLFGKLISIYPANQSHAAILASELIKQTIPFNGPRIPTDRCLNGIVYTRYGAGRPVICTNEMGITDKYIYDNRGNLIKDPFTIPFSLPEGIDWPYSTIAAAQAPKEENVLQGKYKPMGLLKTDPKGSVRQGLWLQNGWQIKWCVIKEGKQYMLSDIHGRDISDRLKWQFQLHNDLQNIIPIPKVIDLFKENGNTYLVMERIKGISFEKWITKALDERPFSDVPHKNRLEIIDKITQVLATIQQMHKKGYVHRDITPGNFMVQKSGKIYLIDLELSYNQLLGTPAPPFRLGTPGFMSPEQPKTIKPEPGQDIFAIGSILIFSLTGLYPAMFSMNNIPLLRKQLLFFIHSAELVNQIAACFNIDPNARPLLLSLKRAVQDFAKEQKQSKIPSNPIHSIESLNLDTLSSIINNALTGLVSPALLTSEGLWHSKNMQEDEFDNNHSESRLVYENFSHGLSGIIFMLARAHRAGFSINSCQSSYNRAIQFIRKRSMSEKIQMPGGLYLGTAGIALALLAGIEAGLIPNIDEYRELIKYYLQNEQLSGAGIAKGIAGKGMVLQNASFLLADDDLLSFLQQKVTLLLAQQEKDGSWISPTDQNSKPLKMTGWGHGMAGILSFLLDYGNETGKANESVNKAIDSGLDYLTRQVINKRNLVRWPLNNKTRLSAKGFQDGTLGIILCLIKAYKYFGEIRYQQLAESALRSFPGNIISMDLTLTSGLVGLGEIYLEALKTFKNEEWRSRALQIVNFLLHSFIEQENGACYWLTDSSNAPSVGLMDGESGIIHFLMRFIKLQQLSHPLSVFSRPNE